MIVEPGKLTGKLYPQLLLGEGVNAAVYKGISVEGHVAIKVASNRDGTLNYLEWCFLARMTGTMMRGMPEVYGLFPTVQTEVSAATRYPYIEEGYVAVMRLYRKQTGRRIAMQEDNFVKIPAYLERLRTAYHRYAANIGAKKIDDLHEGNILFDMGTNSYIIVDTNNDDYVP